MDRLNLTHLTHRDKKMIFFLGRSQPWAPSIAPYPRPRRSGPPYSNLKYATENQNLVSAVAPVVLRQTHWSLVNIPNKLSIELFFSQTQTRQYGFAVKYISISFKIVFSLQMQKHIIRLNMHQITKYMECISNTYFSWRFGLVVGGLA